MNAALHVVWPLWRSPQCLRSRLDRPKRPRRARALSASCHRQAGARPPDSRSTAGRTTGVRASSSSEYTTENLRIVPVFGKAALDVSPRIGHVHITVE